MLCIIDEFSRESLAIRVARHSASGWDNAALPDDMQDVGDLLQLSADAAGRLLREIDSDD